MKRILLLLTLIAVVITSGCKKGFLDRIPLNSPTQETVFKNYNGFLAYSWSLYEVFPGYNAGVNMFINQEDVSTDDLSYNLNANSESRWIANTMIVPTSGGGWDFTYIRKVNIMLGNIDKSELTEQDKLHWRSVGYFFRAYQYFDLLSRFGDVPWIDQVVSDTDVDIINKPRDSRDLVAKNILENLKYAEQNIKPAGDGANTINTNVVRALISRFGLFEGTWRKYHGLAEADIYLTASLKASSEILKVFPNVLNNYDEEFNSENLSGKAGILLYKPYEHTKVYHSMSVSLTTNVNKFDVTRDAMDSYLCKDGKTRWNSPLFEGDKSIRNEFRNRDNRLLLTVLPPYRVNTVGDAWSAVWSYTADPKDREYIDLVAKLVSTPQNKPLPLRQNMNGGVLKTAPHYAFYNESQPWMVTQLGYILYKNYNGFNSNPSDRDETTDAPIFRVAEVMLNYAEAAFEQGQFNQLIADQTINKLRPRAGINPMTVSEINAGFDPTRDQTVDPILWEIRRERRIELFAEGFRFNDLRRWKKGEYAKKQKLGQWVRKADFPPGTQVSIYGGAAEGYLQYFAAPTATWPDYYYLYPLPINDLVLNKKLKQNPDWK